MIRRLGPWGAFGALLILIGIVVAVAGYSIGGLVVLGGIIICLVAMVAGGGA